MKFLVLLSVLVMAQVWPGQKAEALDPSTQILLQTTPAESPEKSGIRSGRYESRKTSSSGAPKKKHTDDKVDTENKDTAAKERKTSQTVKSETTIHRTPAAANEQEVRKEEREKIVATPPEEKEFLGGLFNPILGGSRSERKAFRSSLSADDPRRNFLNVGASLGLLKNDSESRYSFRDYQSTSATASLNLDFWMTPFFGFTGEYITSLNADIQKSPLDRASGVSVQHDDLTYGLGIRRYIGASRLATSLRADLLYRDYRFQVPASSSTRTGIVSNGFGLRGMASLPLSELYTHTVTLRFFPSVKHTEGTTRLGLESGESVATSQLGVEVGGELQINRPTQLYWQLGVQLEKNLFSGAASEPDLKSGTTPSGVAVDNSFSYLRLGYRWGR